MASSGRIIGIGLLAGGVLLGLFGLAWLLSESGGIGQGGTLLGLLLVAMLALPLIGAGAYFLLRGRGAAVEEATIRKERRLLSMVEAQGKLPIADAALELQSSRDEVKAMLYDLVGKQLFSGYINWEEGVLYARQASQLRGDRCPNCGGEIELAGKGIVRCKYCGTEIYLS
jgi:hypothetical protein